MSDQLEESVRQALQDARLDLSLQFHRAADGTRSGTIEIKDAQGTSSHACRSRARRR